jgi:hypothetical protein
LGKPPDSGEEDKAGSKAGGEAVQAKAPKIPTGPTAPDCRTGVIHRVVSLKARHNGVEKLLMRIGLGLNIFVAFQLEPDLVFVSVESVKDASQALGFGFEFRASCGHLVVSKFSPEPIPA